MAMATHSVKPGKVDIIQTAALPLPRPAPVRRSIWFCLAPALLSGVLFWMCYFPLAWGWLGWVALMPLLGLVRAQATPRRIYFCAYAAGSLFFWPVLLWMPVNHMMLPAWILLSLYCAAYFPVAIALIRLFERRTPLPLIVSVPLVWTALEYARSFLLTGFPWYYLGHTQHNALSMIQIADLGGVYLVSFLVAAVNAWLFDLLYQIPRLRDACRWEEPRHLSDRRRSRALGSMFRPGLKYEFGVLLLAVLGSMTYGTKRLSENKFENGPLVALLQTNLPTKYREDEDEAFKARHYDELTRIAMGRHPTPDLIIWPETSYVNWWESSPRLPLDRIPQWWRDREVNAQWHIRHELTRVCPTNHLLGLPTYTLDDDFKRHHYNSALFVSRNSKIAGRYDKIHRVPFGEYVPLRWVPGMTWIAPYENDYSIDPGEKFTRFELNEYQFGVLICYEDTDPVLARQYVREGPDGKPVDFLVNISNDGWFNGASEHEEHLAVSRFRAIECRRSLARSANMGISAVIDGNGRVLAPFDLPPAAEPHTWRISDNDLPLSSWHSYKSTGGVLFARIPLDTRSSFYAVAGDWLPGGCLIAIGAVMAWSIARRRRQALAAGQ